MRNDSHMEAFPRQEIFDLARNRTPVSLSPALARAGLSILPLKSIFIKIQDSKPGYNQATLRQSSPV